MSVQLEECDFAIKGASRRKRGGEPDEGQRQVDLPGLVRKAHLEDNFEIASAATSTEEAAASGAAGGQDRRVMMKKSFCLPAGALSLG